MTRKPVLFGLIFFGSLILFMLLGEPLVGAATPTPTPTPTPTSVSTPTPTPSRITSMQLEVENCDASSGVIIANGEVIDCDEGDWICFKGVNFDPFKAPIPTSRSIPQFTYTVNAKIYHTYETVPQVLVKLDSAGNYSQAAINLVYPSVLVNQNYRDFSVTLNSVPPTGIHDLYLQFVGVEDIGCFNYLRMNFSYRTNLRATPTRRPSPTSVRPPGPSIEPVNGVTAISAGYAHSFAYRNSNAVMGWGENLDLQVYGASSVRINPYTTNLAQVKMMNAGYKRSAAVKMDGTLWMWGNLGYSITTDGYISFADTKDPVQISGLTGVVKAVGGRSHQVALKSDGTVWALWDNTYGQLGNGSAASSLTPVQLIGLTGVIDIAAGWDHALALKNDGTVWAWGYNHYGQLGNGATALIQNIPVQVAGLSNIIAIAGGGGHSVALDGSGRVWSWGSNYFGQLGDGTRSRRLTPVQVSGLTEVSAISAGMWHTVALKSDGTVWTWGDHSRGQLGVTGLSQNAVTPVQVTGLNGFTAVSAGGYFNLALKNDTTVWAWGYNINGQLGVGYAGGGTQPLQVGDLTGMPTPTPARIVTITPTTTPTPTLRVTVTPTATPTPTPTVFGGYAVSYVIQSDWGAGATIGVTITNNTTVAVNGWTLAFTFSGNQTITNLWNGTYTQSGTAVTVKDAGFNGAIGALGGSVNFGFNLNYSGFNAKPTAFTLNGVGCQVQ